MKLASIVISSAIVVALAVACGSSQDRNANTGDIQQTTDTTGTAGAPMDQQRHMPSDTTSGGARLHDGVTNVSWTDGSGAADELGGTTGQMGSTGSRQPMTANAGTGSLSTGTGRPR